MLIINLKQCLYKCVLLGTFLVFLSSYSFAANEYAPVEGMRYNVNAPINANLKSLTGKSVELTLTSGQKIVGVIKEVGDNLLHIEKIQGKEFYDALIRIDNIVAVEGRFREIKR
jgi:small nuclear ribonucleoprotein (snRNP)-like protein